MNIIIISREAQLGDMVISIFCVDKSMKSMKRCSW